MGSQIWRRLAAFLGAQVVKKESMHLQVVATVGPSVDDAEWNDPVCNPPKLCGFPFEVDGKRKRAV